jgi:hypothetical protein
VRDFYSTAARVHQKPDAAFFAEKMLPSVAPDLVSELWPEGREIILFRDPRDIVASILAFNRKRGQAEFGRELVDSDENFVRRLRASVAALHDRWRERPNALLIRYEDLVKDPSAILARTFRFLDIDADDSMCERIVRLAKRPPAAERDDHRTSPTVEASIGRWKLDLPDEVCAVCEQELGEYIEAMGYEKASALQGSESNV